MVDLTLTTPGALQAVAAVRARVPSGVVLGMGSVLTPQDVDAAAHAGAECLFTPTCRTDVIARATGLGRPIVAGAATPTEIATAYERLDRRRAACGGGVAGRGRRHGRRGRRLRRRVPRRVAARETARRPPPYRGRLRGVRRLRPGRLGGLPTRDDLDLLAASEGTILR